MERPQQQCPFIDRVDHRCSSSFSLERLDHAFDVCFDQYKACPLFRELMAERRLQRGRHDGSDEGDARRPSEALPTLWVTTAEFKAAHAASRFVQVRVARNSRL